MVAWLEGTKGIPKEVIELFQKEEVTGEEMRVLGKEGLVDLGVKRKGRCLHSPRQNKTRASWELVDAP